MKILVGLDESEDALRAVEFIAHNFTHQHQITVYTAFPDASGICEFISTGYLLSKRQSLLAVEEKRMTVIRERHEEAKKILLDAGFSRTNITTKIRMMSQNKVRDIIKESVAGYRLVVLGRRSLLETNGLFLGSVSKKVLRAFKNTSILLVGR